MKILHRRAVVGAAARADREGGNRWRAGARVPTPRPADARRRRPRSHVPPTRATPSVIRQCLLTGRREQLTDRTGKSRAFPRTTLAFRLLALTCTQWTFSTRTEPLVCASESIMQPGVMFACVVNYEYNAPLRPFMSLYSIPRAFENSLVIFTSGGLRFCNLYFYVQQWSVDKWHRGRPSEG